MDTNILANAGPVPYSSWHHGSKYNARAPPRRPASRHGHYSSGSKHSGGLRRLQLPSWRTYESKPKAIERERASPLPTWEKISWEHAALNLRHYRTPHAQREAQWVDRHAVSTSECNIQLPPSCRSYFGNFRDLDADGVVMSQNSSAVLRSTLGRPYRSGRSKYAPRPATAPSTLTVKTTPLRPSTAPFS